MGDVSRIKEILMEFVTPDRPKAVQPLYTEEEIKELTRDKGLDAYK